MNPMLPFGTRKCQCKLCGEYFNSDRGFTDHRVGQFMPNTRRCLTPEELIAKGWAKTDSGHWVTEKLDAAARARRAAEDIE